jgi:hypothetical protein
MAVLVLHVHVPYIQYGERQRDFLGNVVTILDARERADVSGDFSG